MSLVGDWGSNSGEESLVGSGGVAGCLVICMG